MLVLTRKAGEGIWIGDDIRVRVLEVRDGQVRVGIQAPEDKGVYRDEVYERILALNLLASRSDDEDEEQL
jgi:carbon storage regulator